MSTNDVRTWDLKSIPKKYQHGSPRILENEAIAREGVQKSLNPWDPQKLSKGVEFGGEKLLGSRKALRRPSQKNGRQKCNVWSALGYPKVSKSHYLLMILVFSLGFQHCRPLKT